MEDRPAGGDVCSPTARRTSTLVVMPTDSDDVPKALGLWTHYWHPDSGTRQGEGEHMT